MKNVTHTRTDSMVPASDQPEGAVWRTPSGGYTGDYDPVQQSILKQRQQDAVAAGEGVVEYAGREVRALLTSRAQAEYTAWQEVMSAVPQGLSSSLSGARDSLAELEGKLGEARARLARLLGNEGRPRTPADVEAWAQRKSELESYVQGIQPYVETAREAFECITGELHAFLMGELAQRVLVARVHTEQVQECAAKMVEKTEQTAEDARIQQQALEAILSQLTTSGTRAIPLELVPTIDTTNQGGK